MKLDGPTLSALVAIFAVVATALGWMVVGGQKAERDLVNERREQRTRYLVNAYHDLAAAMHRADRSHEETRRMEHAIMSIQLFGTKEQIEAISMAQESSDWTPVFEALRNYLREELGMPPVKLGFTFWRW